MKSLKNSGWKRMVNPLTHIQTGWLTFSRGVKKVCIIGDIILVTLLFWIHVKLWDLSKQTDETEVFTKWKRFREYFFILLFKAKVIEILNMKYSALLLC